ncbi:Hypothetical protein KNT65_gp290 [Escherichia phage EcS1]|uniref:Uncharacterized protein n=1 Tax=Escherichia phage EcS1 TaxID=2083276 RepID=A0A2Z5ZD39_9CAUD|nr:Hypothetical protein KNT65_gp290 [Escherichia phage EcS1]BBC78203.1 Hypothetical protein [Escherichia phage EcS1]
MIVYAVVMSEFNCEYGYDEYSKPLKILSSKEKAEDYIKTLNPEDYEEVLVVEYDVE